jgi:hypothetical protein
MHTSDPLAAAAVLAEGVANSIRKRGGALEPVFQAAEDAARAYQAEYGDLDQVVPATQDIGLGFARGSLPDGRAIVRAYMEALAEDMCNASGDLHKKIKEAANISVASLIGWCLTTLGLSAAAACLLAPIAGAVAALGLVAFCRICREA